MGDVFGYSWVSPNDSEATWWLLDFYGKRIFLVQHLDAERSVTSLAFKATALAGNGCNEFGETLIAKRFVF